MQHMKYHMKLVSATMCCLQNTVMCDHSLRQESLSEESVTETYTQTDAVQSDPYLQLCSAGDKKYPMASYLHLPLECLGAGSPWWWVGRHSLGSMGCCYWCPWFPPQCRSRYWGRSDHSSCRHRTPWYWGCRTARCAGSCLSERWCRIWAQSWRVHRGTSYSSLGITKKLWWISLLFSFKLYISIEDYTCNLLNNFFQYTIHFYMYIHNKWTFVNLRVLLP